LARSGADVAGRGWRRPGHVKWNAACSCENSLLSRGVDHRAGGIMPA